MPDSKSDGETIASQDMTNTGRRDFLAGAPAALVTAVLATASASGQDIQKAAAAQKDQSASNPGPENTQLRDANPNTFLPPPTDHGEVQTFWSSFSTAHRRIQEGGWSRQVTAEDFPISKDIAGVNMRLTAGGIRELHWHNAAEWALMLNGTARLTAIDNDGRGFVKDVGVNDLWFFPTGTPQLVLGTVEEYDPATNQWRSCASMPTPRNHLLAAAVNGKIYAIGGRIGSAQITVADDTNVVEEYDRSMDYWADKGRATIRRSGMAGGVYRGKIYLAGGEFQDWEGAKAFCALQSFDPSNGHWETLPRMQLAHHGFAAGFIENTFHVREVGSNRMECRG